MVLKIRWLPAKQVSEVTVTLGCIKRDHQSSNNNIHFYFSIKINFFIRRQNLPRTFYKIKSKVKYIIIFLLNIQLRYCSTTINLLSYIIIIMVIERRLSAGRSISREIISF